MLKFLLFIGLIFAFIFIVVGVFFGKVISFLKNPEGQINKQKERNKYKDEDVIYNKDDVVILKGDSDTNKDDDKR
jgi:hypothetical protein